MPYTTLFRSRINQYLTEQQESQSRHAIHGTPQAIVDQQAVTMPGIDCKLFVGLESVDDIQGLEEMDDWMSADYTLGSDGTRHSLWSFNVPADPTRRKQVWLVTRVIGSPDQRKVFKTLGLPSGVKACQIGSDKKLKAVTLNAVDASPVYLLTHISVPENVTGNLYQQDCWLPSTEMNLFSKMSFTFPLSKLAQVSGQVLVPSGVSFRVITERDLLEAIGSLENQKIFTKEDWGWTTPVLSTATRPYTLNRSYRLPSPACHYFVVKVMREQIAVSGIGGGNVVGFTLQVPSTLNRKGYVLGLKENKVSVFTPEEIRQQGNALGLKLEQSEHQLQKILNNYHALFFTLPWTETAFADVQQHGLIF